MRWPWSRASGPDAGRWVILDVESSGLDPRRDRLLAIAAVAVRVDGERPWIDCVDSFEVLLKQDDDGSAPDKGNILIHGLGVGAQRRGAPPAEALAAFNAWARASPRLGFHVAFDRALIERDCRRQSQRVPRARWVDIEALAAVSYPQVKAKALDEWLAHFAIPVAVRHQAAADTLATAELLLRIWPALQLAGVQTIVDAARVEAGRRWLAAGS
jgi:DNA polymerase-3 subunit epsilon